MGITLDKDFNGQVKGTRISKSVHWKHILIMGLPGTGKTTTALALCNQLYGRKYMKERVLELNASDERGIKVVREKIKSFAKRRVNNDIPIEYKKKYPCPSYKIIILDEADAMTDESQFALRRIIEEYSEITTDLDLLEKQITSLLTIAGPKF